MDTQPPPLPPPPLLPPELPTQIRPAGFWIRLAAHVIDGIVFTLIALPILYGIYGDEYFDSSKLIKGPADFVISCLLPLLLGIFLWVIYRGTPGKLILGLRVVDMRTGDKMDLLQAVGRMLGYFASAIPFGLGFLWVAFDSRKQGFHDKLAGSIVIHK